MMEITANPAPGEELAAVRTLCETLAEEVRKEMKLGPGPTVVWLEGPPMPR